MSKLQTVHKRDDRGRPTDVTFRGDPLFQCPACLTENPEKVGATHWFYIGDSVNMGPVWRMRCPSCHGRWWAVAPVP